MNEPGEMIIQKLHVFMIGCPYFLALPFYLSETKSKVLIIINCYLKLQWKDVKSGILSWSSLTYWTSFKYVTSMTITEPRCWFPSIWKKTTVLNSTSLKYPSKKKEGIFPKYLWNSTYKQIFNHLRIPSIDSEPWPCWLAGSVGFHLLLVIMSYNSIGSMYGILIVIMVYSYLHLTDIYGECRLTYHT